MHIKQRTGTHLYEAQVIDSVVMSNPLCLDVLLWLFNHIDAVWEQLRRVDHAHVPVVVRHGQQALVEQISAVCYSYGVGLVSIWVALDYLRESEAVLVQNWALCIGHEL